MTKRLFSAFEAAGAEYLLISGQASVLYGAAMFTEDVDIWIRPTESNAAKVISALAALGTCIHKLTPPMTRPNLLFGHGFHFIVPDDSGAVYLDIMGKPPRVGSYLTASKRANRIETDWGTLGVVSIEDLVRLKRTRRLSDYEIISNLVAILLARSPASSRTLRWARANTYRAEDLVQFSSSLGIRRSLDICRRTVLRRVEASQRADVEYWRPVLARLKEMRHAGLLWQEGALLASLVPAVARPRRNGRGEA